MPLMPMAKALLPAIEAAKSLFYKTVIVKCAEYREEGIHVEPQGQKQGEGTIGTICADLDCCGVSQSGAWRESGVI